MHPLLATIQRGVQCQSLQTLSASFIDYCVCSLSPGTYKLEPAVADGGITGCAAILYPLPAGIGLVTGARNVESLLNQQLLPVLSRQLLSHMAAKQKPQALALAWSDEDGIVIELRQECAL